MGTVVTPQLVEVIDVFNAQRFRPTGETQQLLDCQLARWGLSMETPAPPNSQYDTEITWVLPELGVRLSRMRTRRRHAKPGPSLLTATTAQWDTHSWTMTDLLLGIEIPTEGAARISRTEEFASAVSRGLIRLSEADYAFRTMHRILGELGSHGSLREWLAAQGLPDW